MARIDHGFIAPLLRTLSGSSLIGASLYFAAAALAQNQPILEKRFALVKFVRDFSATQSLGPRKAGLMCLPNGRIQWEDISPVEPAILRAALADNVTLQGVSMVSALEAEAFSVHVHVTDLHIDACARKFGLGQPNALSGKGSIGMHWVVNKLTGGSPYEFATKADFAFAPKMQDASTPLQAALRASAKVAVIRLREMDAD